MKVTVFDRVNDTSKEVIVHSYDYPEIFCYSSVITDEIGGIYLKEDWDEPEIETHPFYYPREGVETLYTKVDILKDYVFTDYEDEQPDPETKYYDGYQTWMERND